MLRPPRDQSSEEEGVRREGGASGEHRTAMARLGVGGEEMNGREEAEVEQDNAEAEERVLGGHLLELDTTGILTQDANPGITILVYACNSFKKLIRLSIIWTVCHRCPAGARFVLNFSWE